MKLINGVCTTESKGSYTAKDENEVTDNDER